MELTFCEKLPKIELHAHLNGSLSVETLKELRQFNLQNGESQIDDKTWAEWKNLVPLKEVCTIGEVFKAFDIAYSVTKTRGAVKIATERVIEEFAKDNVIYLELRSTLREELKMTKKDYIESLVDAVLNSRKTTPNIIVKIIVSINRRQSRENCEENVKLAVEYSKIYPDIIVGIDLSGDPTKNHFNDFSKWLNYAREAGLRLTVHCGEVPANEEIRDVLNFQPDRLGHGTCIHERFQGDKDNWNLLLKNKLPVELCLTSNIKCKTVPSVDQHHFQYLYQEKHPIVLSTDDKGVFGRSLSQEYHLASTTFHLTKQEVWTLIYNSVDYIFGSAKEKAQLKDDLTKWGKETSVI